MKSKIPCFNVKFKKMSLAGINNLVFKPLLRSSFLNTSEKAIFYAYAFPYFKPSISKYKSICIETGRSRGVLSKFFLSRITFKKYAINGQMIGFKKSRWLWIQVLFL
jgi:ribosomal protein S14